MKNIARAYSLLFLFCISCLWVLLAPRGGEAAASAAPLAVEVTRDSRHSPVGQQMPLLVVWLEPLSGYHTYAHVPGGDAYPTVVTLHGADGGALDVPVHYLPGKDEVDVVDPTRRVRVYHGRTPVFVELPVDAQGGYTVRVSMLLCSNSNCLPFRGEVALTVDGAGHDGLPVAETARWYAQYLEARATTASLAASPPDGATAQAGAAPAVSVPLVAGSDVAGASTAGQALGSSASVPAVAPTDGLAATQSAEAEAGQQSPVAAMPAQGMAGAGGLGNPGATGGVGQQPVGADGATGAATSPAAWRMTPRFHAPELEVTGLGKALLLGLLAGLILNVMPCVLPVVSLKLGTFLRATGEGDEDERRAHFREHNLLFAAGVLSWFVLLAVILSTAGLAWGQLFQRPGVVYGLLLLVFTLGLSMFGVFTLPVLDLKAAGTGSPRMQAYTTGIVATLLATPCSGPLLGGVLGWAFRQPPAVLGLVFVAVGTGMSLPYLLLAARPSLVRFFPRPGMWTGVVERVVGFFLMATSLYLLSILPAEWLWPTLVVLLVTALAAWVWGEWAGYEASTRQRVLVRCAAVLLVAGSAWLSLQPGPPPVHWEPFSVKVFSSRLGREAIVADFTADWCPNCKLLERTTLTDANMRDWAARYGVRLVRVDLTRDNPEAMALLQSLGSSSIPVVALFPKGLLARSPVVLRDLFTPAQMEQALTQAFGPPAR